MEKTYHDIGVIHGDLNGKTTTNKALLLSDSLPSGTLSKPIKHSLLDLSADHFLKHGIKELRQEDMELLKGFDQIYKGPVGDPTRIPPGVLEIGIILKARQGFDQYVNLRPVVLPEGVPCPLVGKTSADINFEICRENSEGLYANLGSVEKQGTDDEVAFQIMKCSYKGVKRLMEYAEGRAFAKAKEKEHKPTIHIVFKNNVLVHAASPWNRVLKEYQEKRKDIDVKYMHVDNFGMQMLLNPKQFDVVITENMFGDIMTDIGSILQGGAGVAVSANLNPTRQMPSMFEPVTGSAPDKWYETDPSTGKYIPGSFNKDKIQLIKPEGAFLAYAAMLDFIGETKAANLMKTAALANLRDPHYQNKTLDALVCQAVDFVRKAA